MRSGCLMPIRIGRTNLPEQQRRGLEISQRAVAGGGQSVAPGVSPGTGPNEGSEPALADDRLISPMNAFCRPYGAYLFIWELTPGYTLPPSSMAR